MFGKDTGYIANRNGPSYSQETQNACEEQRQLVKKFRTQPSEKASRGELLAVLQMQCGKSLELTYILSELRPSTKSEL